MPWIFDKDKDVYLQVVQRYEDYLRLGVLKYGDKLPSVREAAAEMGINPLTVQKAYNILECRGYAVSLPRKGTFIVYRDDGEKIKDERISVIRELKDGGVERETVLEWIKEVYGDDDRD